MNNAKRDGRWSIAGAKARFSALVDLTLKSGPQTVTRHGKDAVVVVAAKSWRERQGAPVSLARFFAESPLRGAKLDLERVRDEARDIFL